jgi:hypothetical protein
MEDLFENGTEGKGGDTDVVKPLPHLIIYSTNNSIQSLLPPMKIQSCFFSATLPLPRKVKQLLEDPFPQDGDEAPFALYLYTMFRKATHFEEFTIP